jgi:hypothetical protein
VKTAGSASETGVDPGNLHETAIKILFFAAYQSRCESNHRRSIAGFACHRLRHPTRVCGGSAERLRECGEHHRLGKRACYTSRICFTP